MDASQGEEAEQILVCCPFCIQVVGYVTKDCGEKHQVTQLKVLLLRHQCNPFQKESLENVTIDEDEPEEYTRED